METTITEVEEVQPKNPIFVEGLPGIGLIGKIAVECLISELDAKKFAELYSPYFPHQALVQQDSSVRLVRDEFYYASGEQDIILLTGDTQVPPSNSYGHYDVIQTILDFLERHNTKEIYTLGGYSTGGKMVEKPLVLGSGTCTAMVKKFSRIDPDVVFRDDIGAAIVGASGLLLALGKLREIEGVCLLGESSGVIIDPKAAKSVLLSLCKFLNIEIALEALEMRIKENEKIMKDLQKFQEMAQQREMIQKKRRDMEYIR
jgi:hypothetical protein